MRLSTSTNISVIDQGKNYAVPMEEAVRMCARAGYTFIDANLCSACRPDMPLTRPDWERWANDLRALGDALGVRFTQAHAYWPIGLTVPADGSRADGEWGEELMRRSVLAAQTLGVEWMVVHPFAAFDNGLYSPGLSMRHNRAYFSRWGEYYASHGVGMAIENMPGRTGARAFGIDPEELIALVEAIDNPLVEICLDTGHAHLSGVDVPGAILKLGKHLRAMHVADNHQNKDEHFAPFNGTIDWAGVMRALRAIDYRQDFAFEIQKMTGCYPAAVHQKLIDFSFALGNYLLTLE